MQSRRIFEETGTWPALYGGGGGGHGYVRTEEKIPVGFDGYNGDLTGGVSATLGVNCGMSTGRNGVITPNPIAFAANQRDEVRDLHDVAGALGAQPGMKQQTFVADAQQIQAFHVNQRDEIIDLHGVSGALLATRNMQMQTFVAQEPNCLNGWDTQQSRVFTPEGVSPTLAGADGGGGRNPAGLLMTAAFIPNAGVAAQNIGYQDECAPTIKTSHAPAVLCLNDQGGSQMHLTHDVSGTLRAQEHGHQPLVFDNHGQDARFTGPMEVAQTVSAGFGMGGNNQPLVMATQQGGAEIGEGVCPTITASAGMSGNNQPVLFENHGIDSRYTGPHPVAPTMSARYGTGGNNVPLVAAEPGEAICIAGNAIDRQPQNGGNGLGCQPEVAYTLTATDHHAVFSRQRSDEFSENEVVATQSARQHKDATDLVRQPYQQTVGTIGYSDHKGVNNQFVSEDKCIVEKRNLIRRLTPLECERLQGFPDGWTLIPGASDSARYKALGNSVAIPCVEFLMRGIAYFLRKIKEWEDEPPCISTPTT